MQIDPKSAGPRCWLYNDSDLSILQIYWSVKQIVIYFKLKSLGQFLPDIFPTELGPHDYRHTCRSPAPLLPFGALLKIMQSQFIWITAPRVLQNLAETYFETNFSSACILPWHIIKGSPLEARRGARACMPVSVHACHCESPVWRIQHWLISDLHRFHKRFQTQVTGLFLCLQEILA